MSLASQTLWSAAALLVLAGVPAVAKAQTGTGGTTGTTGNGTLAANSFFLSVQKEEGVNLTDYNRPQFLNRASCQCKRPAWLQAVLLPSAASAAAAVSPTAAVTLVIGNQCDQPLYFPACQKFAGGSTVFSNFRLNGLRVPTTVEVLSNQYGGSTTCVNTTGTGGTSGTGGTNGTGGTSGTGGTTGTGGTSGTGGTTGTGGVSGTGGTCGTGCDGVKFNQTMWVLISNTGALTDVADASMTFSIDPEPPPAPTVAKPASANEALIINWTDIDPISIGGDLLGYQILCTRADTLPVFKTGTFGAAFDSCDQLYDPATPIATLNNTFACSGLLGSATNSARLKILENGIYYGVGVVAIDKSLNASPTQPQYEKPVETTDFYTLYRENDPQGQATGGYCSVANDSRASQAIASLLGLALFGMILGRKRPPRSRG